jgi:hypothetical protein
MEQQSGTKVRQAIGHGGRSAMKAVVVYESMWGNTAAVARAIAEGIGSGAMALSTSEATPQVLADVDLVVAGAPLIAFNLATEGTRRSIGAQGATHALWLRSGVRDEALVVAGQLRQANRESAHCRRIPGGRVTRAFQGPGDVRPTQGGRTRPRQGMGQSNRGRGRQSIVTSICARTRMSSSGLHSRCS